MSREALLWSGGCSVTHGRQLLFLWCLWNQLGEGRNTAPSCSSEYGHWIWASPSAAQWEMGSGHRPDSQNFDCKHPIRGQTHSCDSLQVPRGARVQLWPSPGSKAPRWRAGSPSSGGAGSAVTSATLCLYRPHFNTNAADSCSHIQIPSALPWFSVHFLLSQGQSGSSKRLQAPKIREEHHFQSSHTQSHQYSIQLHGDPKI